jgi:aromatic amino acid transport protein AroP
MFMTPGIRISVCLIPAWLLVLGAGYMLKKKRRRRSGSGSESRLK